MSLYTWNTTNNLLIKDRTMTKEEYIKYFKHMEEEEKKSMLGGMAWDDVNYFLYCATKKDKVFTLKELKEMFPSLLGWIEDE